jgi:hypothetical protein
MIGVASIDMLSARLSTDHGAALPISSSRLKVRQKRVWRVFAWGCSQHVNELDYSITLARTETLAQRGPRSDKVPHDVAALQRGCSAVTPNGNESDPYSRH